MSRIQQNSTNSPVSIRQPATTTSVSVFIKISLEKILTLTTRKPNDLKTETIKLLETLKNIKDLDGELFDNPMKFMKPFQLAIASKTDKIIEVAIDCLQV